MGGFVGCGCCDVDLAGLDIISVHAEAHRFKVSAELIKVFAWWEPPIGMMVI